MPNEEEALQNRVRLLMQAAGMNQTQLDEAVGITSPKLSLSLSGDRRFSTFELAAIAEQFHTTVDCPVAPAIVRARADRRGDHEPAHPAMTEQDVSAVVDALRKAVIR